MELTEIGAFLLVLSMLLYFGAKHINIITLLFIAVVLHAASVVNIRYDNGVYGVTPFLGIIGVMFVILMVNIGLIRGHNILINLGGDGSSLLCYLIWSLAITIISPMLHMGKLVRSPYNAYTGELLPLNFTIVNFSQIIGLICIWVMFVVVMYYYAERKINEKNVRDGLIIAMLIVGGINMYEQYAHATGAPSFAYLWANHPNYNLDGIIHSYGWHARIGMPFSEPSYASGFVSAICCGLLLLMITRTVGWWVYLMKLYSLLVLFSTGGTTGILTYGCFFVLAWLYCVIVLIHDIVRRFGVSVSGRLAVIFIGCTFLLLILQPGDIQDSIRLYLDGMVSGKLKYSNLGTIARLEADFYGIELMMRTYGIGVGMGSNRTSSFISSMLSSVGVIGLTLFLIFILRIVKDYISHFDGLNDTQIFAIGALIAVTVSVSLSIPDLNLPYYWVLVLVAHMLRPKTSL